jgi:hypothetical protein
MTTDLEEPVRLQKLNCGGCSIHMHKPQEEPAPRHGRDATYRQNKRAQTAFRQLMRDEQFIVNFIGARLQHKRGGVNSSLGGS